MENGDRYNSKIDVDTSGKEFNSYTLFGENEKIFEMMLRQYYGNEFDENNWGTVISFHIENGLEHKDFNEIF
jgi:DNA sulfur modification protein DndE